MVVDKSKIEIILARRQMTATTLCKKAGFSRNRFYEIMRSKKINPKTAGRVAEILGVDVTEIIEPEN